MDNFIQGTRRERIDVDELRRLKKAGAVFLDARRRRPLWFDGRFLKAHDLNREQNYFLTRQADLAVATGTGVIDGLEVKIGDKAKATCIVIGAGHGVTNGGERLVIAKDITIDLADIPIIQRYNVALGLSRLPAPPLRSRSGLYIVVLRPLEFTANPIASYPTQIDEKRSLEDGEIIEATAVTLVPYALDGNMIEAGRRRAQAADQIFVTGSEVNVPSSCLPLAMIELERGNVRWIDNHMVRRDMGMAYSDVLGFGLAPRPLRQAHYKQYQAMLTDVIAERGSVDRGLRFAATEHFLSLPAAGRMPRAAVDMSNGTQAYFPAEMDVALSIVPEDEIATLIEESMLLPPCELAAPEKTLEATSILILVPVPRNQIISLIKLLTPLPVVLKPALTATRTHLKSVDAVTALRAKLPVFKTSVAVSKVDLSETAWRSLVKDRELLWYVRCRNLNYKDDIAGESVSVTTDESSDEDKMTDRLKEMGLDDRIAALKGKGTAAANLAMVKLLLSPKFAESKIMAWGVVRELEDAEKLDERVVLTIARRYAEAGMVDDLKRLEAVIKETEKREDGTEIEGAAERNRERAEKLTDSLKLPETAMLIRKLEGEKFRKFSIELNTILDDKERTKDDVSKLIEDKYGSPS